MNEDTIPVMALLVLIVIIGLAYMGTERDKLMIERGYIWQPAQWIKVEEVKE